MAPSAFKILAAALSLSVGTLAKDWLSPPYNYLYQFPLPLPAIKQEKWPDKDIKNPVTGKRIKYYEINIKELTQQVYPNLPKPAVLVGYDGKSPGPTFFEERGTESFVRFINNGRMANSVHLHGSYSRAPFDGWAEDVTQPGEAKDYYYPNNQSARMLWYHDHAIDHTAENAYFGQAGVYYLHDPQEDSLALPGPYGVYDIPLVLAAKQYNSDGTLYSPAQETTSLYGDIIHVNGQPWPHFKVEARRYRFRFLDASISRSFFLYFEQDTKPGTKLDFWAIGSDAGLLDDAQKIKDLYISMAERYEIIFDFGKYAGQNITLRNTRGFAADEDFIHTDKVMKFIVGAKPATPDASRDVDKQPHLRAVPFPPDRSVVDHHFKFERQNGHWTINGVVFSDVANRVLAKPKRGTVEVWELENSSGGWTHPIHIHLIDFKVVKRTGGKRGVMPYEAHGLKDVVWLGPGETVTVEAYYAPWPGVYMFHCHNLIHEDHEMMAAFNVSVITDLGYDEKYYVDPMDPAYRAKPQSSLCYQYDGADCPSGVKPVPLRIADYCYDEPYDHIDAIEGVLANYYSTKSVSTAKPTSTSKSGSSGKGSGKVRFRGLHERREQEMPKRTAAPAP